MSEYHKIQTIYKRDPETKHRTLLDGNYSLLEFGYLKVNEWIFTEKVDGTNIRVECADYAEDGKQYGITFKGKTDRAQIHSQLVGKLEQRFHNEKTRKQLFDLFNDGGVTLYGEGYGDKIQNGRKYRADQDFILFDIRIDDLWLDRADVEDIAATLGLDIVPIIGSGTLDDMVSMVREGLKSEWGDFMAEGIVARPFVELLDRRGNRIITKIKHKDFRGK